MAKWAIAGGLLVVCLHLEAAPVQAKVTAIVDGDTIKVLIDNREATLRIANIDAPEKCQPFGGQATGVMTELVLNSIVKVEVKSVDQHGRSVAAITMANGEDLSAALIDRGAAWVYRKYSADPLLLQAEANARRFSVGLWRTISPEAPWDWRSKGLPCSNPNKVSDKSTPRTAPTEPPKPSNQLSPNQAAAVLAPMVQRSEAAAAVSSGIYANSGGGGSYGVVGVGASGSGKGPIQTGPRGGQYTVGSGGNKDYVKR